MLELITEFASSVKPYLESTTGQGMNERYYYKLGQLYKNILEMSEDVKYMQGVACYPSASNALNVRVQAGGHSDKTANTAIKITKLKRRIEAAANEYLDTRALIIADLEKIADSDENRAAILYKRLILNKSFDAIAHELDISVTHTKRLYYAGVGELEQLHNDTPTPAEV